MLLYAYLHTRYKKARVAETLNEARLPICASFHEIQVIGGLEVLMEMIFDIQEDNGEICD